MFPGIITLLFLAAAAFVLGIVVATYFERSRMGAELAAHEKSAKTLEDQLAEARTQLDHARTEGSELKSTVARLEERHAATERMVEQMRVGLPETFKSLANEVLEEKSKHFSEQNQTSLGRVLEPLKVRLEDFQTKIEAARLEQVRGGEKLSAHIDKLFESNTRIGDQANNLAVALRGSSKAQGAWGELILERTLQAAGLRPGHEYDAQESYASQNGSRGQPDVVIHLPGEVLPLLEKELVLRLHERGAPWRDDPLEEPAGWNPSTHSCLKQ